MFHAFKKIKWSFLLLLAAPASTQAFEWKSSENFKSATKRDYLAPVQETEKAIIAKILHTLHHTSYAKLTFMQGKLDRMGKKIDHIHPLRHTLTVFTDSTLRSDLRAISKYSLIWRKYTERFAERFIMEAEQGNLTNWQIQDFAQQLRVSASTAEDLLTRKRWREFLEWLLTAVP